MIKNCTLPSFGYSISKDVKIVYDSNSTYLSYTPQDNEERIHICSYMDHCPKIYCIIPHLRIVVAGDLSFYMTATGRDGHSHVCCPYCNLSNSLWTNRIVKGTPMTLKTSSSLCTST